MEIQSPEHIHINCRDIEDKMPSHFNGYFENDQGQVKNVWSLEDEIFIVSLPKNLQLTLFN